MACYFPVVAYRSKDVNPSGKRSLVLNPRSSIQGDDPIRLPCGQCIGCRLERSRQWAVRCVHEASLYERNCFITLTYDNEHLPSDGSLCLRDFQLFMKRLRKKFGKGIRFFHCGEYGEQFGRPHYHAILFNFDFSDKKLVSSRDGNELFESEDLYELWPFGLSRIGSVSFDSAAYVARYCTKKVNGRAALAHYCSIDYSTGEILLERRPEYATMSRRPGIGAGWLEKFSRDVYPKDCFHINGRECRPPKFYDRRFELVDPYVMDDVLERRVLAAKRSQSDNSYDRLTAKRVVKEAHLKQLTRRYESET